MKGDTKDQVIWFVLTLEVEDEFTTNIWGKLLFLTDFHQKINKQYLFACYFPSVNEEDHKISNDNIHMFKTPPHVSLMLSYACLAVDM